MAIKNILNNKIELLIYFLLGILFGWFVVPFILNIKYIKNIFVKNSYLTLLIIPTLIFMISILLSYKPLVNFWQRLKNNYKLKDPPFTIFEKFSVFIGTSFLTVLFYMFINRVYFDVSLYNKLFFLILVFVVLFSIWTIISFFNIIPLDKKEINEKTKLAIEETSFQLDEPIIKDEDDLLERDLIIKSIYNQIMEFPYPDSFTMGITGGWGTGKTSVLNLLKNKLKKESNVIIIEFNPWNFKNDEVILKNFYDCIWKSINEVYFFPDLKRYLQKYSSLLSLGIKQLYRISDFSILEPSIHDIRKNIEKCIRKIDRRIVVFMDDVDRLNPEEIILVLKTIKITANFNKITFVLALDESRTKSCLEKSLKFDSCFLEKIIQHPITLPAIEQIKIDRFLLYNDKLNNRDSAFEKLFWELKIDEKNRQKFFEEFRYLYEKSIKHFFPTLRKAKRYINGLRMTLAMAITEVNLTDFAVLEVIRLNHPELYNDIYPKWWFYVNQKSKNEPSFLSPFFLREDKKNGLIIEHVNHILNEIQDNYLKEIYLELLCKLFSNIDSAYERNVYDLKEPELERKIDSSSFSKYFILKIPEDEIPTGEIFKIIECWNNLDKEKFPLEFKKDLLRYQDEKKLIELLNRMMLYLDKIYADTATNIVEILYKESNLFTQAVRRGFEESQLDRAEILILKLLDEKIRDETIQPLIEDMIDKSTAIFFPVRLILDCDKEKISGFYRLRKNIDLDKLRELMLKKLETYFIVEKRDIFKEEIACIEILCIWSSNWYKYDGRNKKTVNDYVFSLIDENPRYIGILVKEWSKGPEDKQLYIKDMEKYFDLDKIYSIITKFEDKSYSNKEEKEAVDLFKDEYESLNR